MAEETFNQLYERYNTDDVFNRVVIIGLLDLLNHKLKYDQVWDDNVVEEVVVPFMYDFGSSDERFAQDNYTFFGTTCFNEKKITGKFDMLPRGAIKYTGSAIDSGNITNRFIKGTFLKNENGKPYIENDGVHFSLSHTHGLAVCVVADTPVGVDCERIDAKSEADMQKFANRFFVENEINTLKNGGYSPLDFYKIWTGKEAVIKKRGSNMSDIKKIDVTQENLEIFSENGYIISINI
jgi:phosphopantetheinyl transferase (holo-ACP synthase)